MTTGFTGKRQLQGFSVGPVRNLLVPQREFVAIVRADDAILARDEAGLVSGHILGNRLTVNYAFGSQGEMTDHFTPLFKDVLEQARGQAPLERVHLSLEDNPTRPWVEPLFADSGFQRLEEWVRMILPDPSNWPAQQELASGLEVRPATEGDIDAITHIDATCFGEQALGEDGQQALLGSLAHVAVGVAGNRVVAYIQVRRTLDNAAEIFELAVLPDERGHRYGSTLLEYALRWIGETEPRDEMPFKRVEVTVSTSDSEALDLMRRYGFNAHRSGNTYHRPADDKAVEAANDDAKRRSFLLRFGDWR